MWKQLTERFLVFPLTAYHFCFLLICIFKQHNLVVSAYKETYSKEHHVKLFQKNIIFAQYKREALFNNTITSKYKYGSSASSSFQT